jgi:predicted metal-dependent phosphotriesterase family hydrolase
MSSVRTVLGDIAPTDLGRTDYHEHLFQVPHCWRETNWMMRTAAAGRLVCCSDLGSRP